MQAMLDMVPNVIERKKKKLAEKIYHEDKKKSERFFYSTLGHSRQTLNHSNLDMFQRSSFYKREATSTRWESDDVILAVIPAVKINGSGRSPLSSFEVRFVSDRRSEGQDDFLTLQDSHPHSNHYWFTGSQSRSPAPRSHGR
jgi:hypothetical protein